MEVSLKEEYSGVLTLEFDPLAGEFKYMLSYSAYPKYMPESIEIEEGDELVVRSPLDGSMELRRNVEFDYDSHRRMDIETGRMHQIISMRPVRGILTNIEPSYWLSLFTNGYHADLIKAV